MSTQHENSQMHVRMALDEAFERQQAAFTGQSRVDEGLRFCSDPSQYDWKCAGKNELLVPFNRNPTYFATSHCTEPSLAMNSPTIRWERHHVWVVDGVLHRGESNVLARRTFYIEECTWLILWGEGYNLLDLMVKWYLLDRCPIARATAQGRWYHI